MVSRRHQGLPSISIDNVVLLQRRLVAFEEVLDLLCGSVGPLYVGGMQHLQKFWPVVVTSMLWWKIVVKLALEWRFWRLLGVNMALVRRFQGPLAVTLAMEWRFQGLLAVKLALERRFRERLGAWKDPKGAPGYRKERPIAPELTPRGRKSMRSKPWKPQKTNFVKQLPQVSVLECFFIDFWCFREVSEASEVPRLSAKTRVGPFALWVALEPQKTSKM